MSNEIVDISTWYTPNVTTSRLWALGKGNLDDLIRFYIDQQDGIFKSNVSNSINSIRMYPFPVRKEYTTIPFPITRSNVIFLLGVDTNVVGAKINIGKDILDGDIYDSTKEFGSIPINKTHKNFLDYSPYTKYQIYIPYFGFFDINTNEIVGKELKLSVCVDYYSGVGEAFLTVIDGTEKNVIFQTSNKIGIDIAFGSTNAADVSRVRAINTLKGLAGAAALTAGALATAGIGAAMAASGATTFTPGLSYGMIHAGRMVSGSIIGNMNNVVRYNKGNASSSACDLFSPQKAYLIKTTNKSRVPDDYGHFFGVPLLDSRKVSELRGFTKFSNIHLDNISRATSEELAELDELLTTGVIFPK